MPNWCAVDMVISGDPAAVQAFRAKVEKVEAAEDSNLPAKRVYDIFESLLPMPAELSNTTSPVPDSVAPEQRADLIAKYGTDNWYDWQRKNWGVKWGDCNTQLLATIDDQALGFTFDTPWGPPTVGLLTISAGWPTLLFEIKYFESGMQFQGEWRAQGGRVLHDTHAFYDGDRGG